MTRSRGRLKSVSLLAVAGGLAFAVANFGISLTPIAAEYRTALAISYVPMLLEALLGGLIIGVIVSYCLLRFSDKIPTGYQATKSLVLTFVALLMLTALVEVPAKFAGSPHDPWRYFFIGMAFNVLRFLALGLTIGVLSGRISGRCMTSARSA